MTQKSPIKILVAGGGHLTPALATMEALLNQPTKLLFIGRKYTDTHQSPAHERAEVASLGVDFIPFIASKFHRKPLLLNLAELIKFPSSLSIAAEIIDNFKPALVLSFGGHLALPFALAASRRRIPIVTHEQTLKMGLANRIIASLADKVALSWPDSDYTDGKAVLTGNPIRSSFGRQTKSPSWFKRRPQKPLVFVTGGNQGSLAINQAIASSLVNLTKKYCLVHQTGSTRANHDLNQLTQAKQLLPANQRANYYPIDWLSASDMAWLINHSDLVIGRAGANTVAELLVAHTPSILIPLPHSGGGEQHHNALYLQNLGLSYLLPEQNLNTLPIIITYRLNQPAIKPSPEIIKLTKLHLQAAGKLAKLSLSCARRPKN